MSGRFSGLQSKIKDRSPLTLYIHCCAHNLNLVLIDSIRSSINAVSFFGILEALYTFITNSLPRLKIFEEQKKIDGLVLTLKQTCCRLSIYKLAGNYYLIKANFRWRTSQYKTKNHCRSTRITFSNNEF